MPVAAIILFNGGFSDTLHCAKPPQQRALALWANTRDVIQSGLTKLFRPDISVIASQQNGALHHVGAVKAVTLARTG